MIAEQSEFFASSFGKARAKIVLCRIPQRSFWPRKMVKVIRSNSPS
jgi:hypothetical protein